jgi:hypothetical protein
MFEVFWFFLCGLKSLKRFITCLVEKVILHREKVFAALGLGMVLLSLGMLVKVEELSGKADVVFQKCEAKLAEKVVEVPMIAERSTFNLDPNVIKPIIVVCMFFLLYFFVIITINTNKRSRANDASDGGNSFRDLPGRFVEPSIDTPPGGEETDNSLIEGSTSLNDAPPQELVELTSVDPSTLVHEAIISPLVPELISYLDILS